MTGLLNIEFYNMQGIGGEEKAEKQRLKKKVDESYVRGEFKLLVDYMVNPDKDEHNEGYTIEQRKEAMRLEKDSSDDQVFISFKATTVSEGIRGIKSLDDKLKDYIDEGSPENILLSSEIEDGSGTDDYKDIEIGYMKSSNSGLF